MKSTGEEDLRVKKTLSAIHSTFTDMLLEMPYEKITVTELSRRANINKKTFYRHYPTLDDLLEEVQFGLAQPFAELTAGLRYPDDVDAITREFLLYSSQQGDLYDAVVSSGMHDGILTKVMEQMGAERTNSFRPPQGWSNEEWSLYLGHVNASQVRVYKQWVTDGRIVPVNRMISLGVRLVCDGAFMEKSWQQKGYALSA